jgi:hypothetical protein
MFIFELCNGVANEKDKSCGLKLGGKITLSHGKLLDLLLNILKVVLLLTVWWVVETVDPYRGWAITLR